MSAQTRADLLLTAAALAYLAGALPLVFAPDEVLRALGEDPSPLAALVAQLAGAALFGFAMLDWMSRGSLIGGIYGRPLVVANLAHAFIAAIALGRHALDQPIGPAILVALAVYAALAIGFGYKLFATPAAATRGE